MTHTHTHGIMEADKPQDLQSELVVGKLEPWRTDSVDSISKVIMEVPVFQFKFKGRKNPKSQFNGWHTKKKLFKIIISLLRGGSAFLFHSDLQLIGDAHLH